MSLDLAVHELEELLLHGADVLGVEALAQRGRAGEIGEEHSDDATLLVRGDAACAWSAAPQLEQKAAEPACSLPQAGQTVRSGVPQAGQKRTPSGSPRRRTSRRYPRPESTGSSARTECPVDLDLDALVP